MKENKKYGFWKWANDNLDGGELLYMIALVLFFTVLIVLAIVGD